MDYLVIKWLHIMSSTFLFGTGVGSAFYLLFATLSRDTRAVAFVTRYVVLADWLFTTTTVFVQPITGYLLMRIGGFPMSSKWIMWSVGLYVLAIVCWLPVVWLQYRLKRSAAATIASNSDTLPSEYWRDFRWWVALGFPAFFAFITIFYLMVAKPS